MKAGLAAAVVMIWAGALDARAAPAAQAFQMSGAVGDYRIGMGLDVQTGAAVSGHYFYASQLKDIAVRQASGSGPLTLAGADGSTFHLHYVGNGSEHGAPLDFNNSIGLAGTWTQGARTLPVKLNFDSAGPAPAPDHRYAIITNAPDAVVEANARQFLHGVLTNDREAAAKAVSYPLRVNEAGGRHMTLRDRAALLAHWDAIFTPSYLAVLKTAVPHDMFVRDQGAMVAKGAVWFDGKGASVLNLGM